MLRLLDLSVDVDPSRDCYSLMFCFRRRDIPCKGDASA